MTAYAHHSDGIAQDLEHLYRQHHGWLERWISRRTQCSARAAELAHDTFLRVLTRRRKLDVDTRFDDPQAYLATIARGLLIDDWRRRDLERAWLDTLAAQPQIYSPGADETADILRTLHRIDRMLAGLRPPICEAFLLAKCDGMTCAQISQHMGVSGATVERYIAQVLRHCYDIVFDTP